MWLGVKSSIHRIIEKSGSWRRTFKCTHTHGEFFVLPATTHFTFSSWILLEFLLFFASYSDGFVRWALLSCSHNYYCVAGSKAT